VPILILEAVWIVSCVLLLLLAAADLSILGVAFVLAAALMVGVFLTLEAAAFLDRRPPIEARANSLGAPGPAAAVPR
jgi:Na+-transporting methylmalonyl-CoA/oxaloacetate decarboxylase gamma subunit